VKKEIRIRVAILLMLMLSLLADMANVQKASFEGKSLTKITLFGNNPRIREKI
jgi:hypothetical protein